MLIGAGKVMYARYITDKEKTPMPIILLLRSMLRIFHPCDPAFGGYFCPRLAFSSPAVNQICQNENLK